MIRTKSQIEIDNDIAAELSANGVIVGSDPTLQGLNGVYSNKLAEVNSRQRLLFDSHRLTSAGGSNLDSLGKAYGLTRYVSRHISDSTLTNFKFYLPVGKVGADYAVDPQRPLIIPKGARITNVDWIFYTTDDVVIQPESNSGYVGIVAANKRNTDILAGSLSTHDVSADAVDNLDITSGIQLMCSNDKTLVVGPLEEPDDDFRLRIYQRIQSMNNSNNDAIKLALAEIDINATNFFYDVYGVGTLGVEITTEFALISDNIFNAADAIIKSIAPYARVIRPDYLNCAICLNLTLVNYQEGFQDSTLTEITSSLYDYINSLELGASLSMTQITDLATRIENVSSAKISAMKINGRRVAILDQVATSTEKFLVLTDGIEFKL